VKFEPATGVRPNSRARPKSTTAVHAVKASVMRAQIFGGPCLSVVGARNPFGFVIAVSRLGRRRNTRRRRQFKFESESHTFHGLVVKVRRLQVFLFC
jgi:hypothetical protein